MPNTAIYSAKQIREIEATALKRYAITAETLMQHAGKAAFLLLHARWPQAKKIAIICGAGNNGGDGYVLAKLAHAKHYKVQVWSIGDTKNLKGAALSAYEACQKAGVPIHPFCHQSDVVGVDLIVDAVHGIGLLDEVRQESRLAIEWINQSGVPVMAIDLPSGIHADTGAVLGVAVKAQVTLTFLGVKLGLLTGQGMAYAGEIVCDDLQLSPELFAQFPGSLEKMNWPQFAVYRKARARDAHKSTFGHVLVVGGDVSYAGAPRMAAEAALRVGAGLVTVATQPKHAALLTQGRPEIIACGVRSGLGLRDLLKKVSVVVIGPGLGTSFWGKSLLAAVLKSRLPIVMDADALNNLAHHPVMRRNWILTPHPGEAARLLKTSVQEVQADRLKALRDLQHRYDGVVVLKGAGSLVLASHHQPAICPYGNPGMATAGMGDVLSGVIGGLVAQGLPLFEAAKLGVCLHAKAGDQAATAGERGLLAMDLMPYLRELMNEDLTPS